MLEQYLVRADSLENVSNEGKVTGFKFGVKSPGYRGNFLSLTNGFYLVVDGERIEASRQKIEVNGQPPRSFDETKKAVWEFWNMGDEAFLHVKKDGGLTPGMHTIVLQECSLEQYGYSPMDQKLVDNPPCPGEPIPGKIFDPVTYTLELQGEV